MADISWIRVQHPCEEEVSDADGLDAASLEVSPVHMLPRRGFSA